MARALPPVAAPNDGYARAFERAAALVLAAFAASFVVPGARARASRAPGPDGAGPGR
jgi:hypothetical protein